MSSDPALPPGTGDPDVLIAEIESAYRVCDSLTPFDARDAERIAVLLRHMTDRVVKAESNLRRADAVVSALWRWSLGWRTRERWPKYLDGVMAEYQRGRGYLTDQPAKPVRL